MTAHSGGQKRRAARVRRGPKLGASSARKSAVQGDGLAVRNALAFEAAIFRVQPGDQRAVVLLELELASSALPVLEGDAVAVAGCAGRAGGLGTRIGSQGHEAGIVIGADAQFPGAGDGGIGISEADR